MLLYLDGCSATYVTKGGKRVDASNGEILYVPAGSEYVAEFYGFRNEESSTVNINFLLFDHKGEILNDPNEIERFSVSDAGLFVKELEHVDLSIQQIPSKYNVLIYNLLNAMGDESEKSVTYSDGFELIRDAVEYLHIHYNENVSVSQLSHACNISEVYFRRLFKRHMGCSPAEYRQKLRMEHACRYLKYSESSVSEIAEVVGFVDSSYFIKSFKEHFGTTPLNYRKHTI